MTLKRRKPHTPPDPSIIGALASAKVLIDTLKDEIHKAPKQALSNLILELKNGQNKEGTILKFGLFLDEKVDITPAIPTLQTCIERDQAHTVRYSASSVLVRHFLEKKDDEEINGLLKVHDSSVAYPVLLALTRYKGDHGYLSHYVSTIIPLVHADTAELALFLIGLAAEQGSTDAQSYMKYFFRKPPQA